MLWLYPVWRTWVWAWFSTRRAELSPQLVSLPRNGPFFYQWQNSYNRNFIPMYNYIVSTMSFRGRDHPHCSPATHRFHSLGVSLRHGLADPFS